MSVKYPFYLWTVVMFFTGWARTSRCLGTRWPTWTNGEYISPQKEDVLKFVFLAAVFIISGFFSPLLWFIRDQEVFHFHFYFCSGSSWTSWSERWPRLQGWKGDCCPLLDDSHENIWKRRLQGPRNNAQKQLGQRYHVFEAVQNSI